MVAFKEATEKLEPQVQDLSEDDRVLAQNLLDKIRSILKKRLSFFIWQGFFEPLEAVCFKDAQLTVQAPTSFHRNWVMDHYMPEFNSAASDATGESTSVLITFSHDKKIKEPKDEQKAKKNSAKVKSTKKKSSESPKKSKVESVESERDGAPEILESEASVLRISNNTPVLDTQKLARIANTNLNPSYTFEHYVLGPSNQMGFTAANSVADHPGEQFSPLFIFGGVGLGKTHLLHAIGIHAKQKNPSLKVVYMSAEQWVNSYIQAIRERRFDSFRNRFRNDCDFLLIDDIQFLAGKDASQDEFFHTFNCLHESKKQIVVTSDKYPHEISGLEERLQTRLSWGLIADIRPPEIETRIAILHKKAEKLSIKIENDVLHYLATNVKSSVRELEGALVRIAACSTLSKEPLSLNRCKEFLAPMIKQKKSVLSWQKINEVVATYYDLRPADLVGKSRQKQVVFARQVAMSFCRSLMSMSLPEIGRIFGGRDHSTVLSSLRKIEDHKNNDISFQSVLNKLEMTVSNQEKN